PGPGVCSCHWGRMRQVLRSRRAACCQRGGNGSVSWSVLLNDQMGWWGVQMGWWEGVCRGAGYRLPNGTLAGIEVRTGSGDRDPGQVRHECRFEFAVRLGE